MIFLLLANTVSNDALSAPARAVAPSRHAATPQSAACRDAQGRFSIRCLPPGTVVKRGAVPPPPPPASDDKGKKRARPEPPKLT